MIFFFKNETSQLIHTQCVDPFQDLCLVFEVRILGLRFRGLRSVVCVFEVSVFEAPEKKLPR